MGAHHVVYADDQCTLRSLMIGPAAEVCPPDDKSISAARSGSASPPRQSYCRLPQAEDARRSRSPGTSNAPQGRSNPSADREHPWQEVHKPAVGRDLIRSCGTRLV
jgi:hypothetical protein